MGDGLRAVSLIQESNQSERWAESAVKPINALHFVLVTGRTRPIVDAKSFYAIES